MQFCWAYAWHAATRIAAATTPWQDLLCALALIRCLPNFFQLGRAYAPIESNPNETGRLGRLAPRATPLRPAQALLPWTPRGESARGDGRSRHRGRVEVAYRSIEAQRRIGRHTIRRRSQGPVAPLKTEFRYSPQASFFSSEPHWLNLVRRNPRTPVAPTNGGWSRGFPGSLAIHAGCCWR